MEKQKGVIVGISGCSSSGKTTLARLLRDIFPNTFILHEDDFYKPEDQLPIKHGLADWDCPEALSLPDMEQALTHIRQTGTFPVSILENSPILSHRHYRHEYGCRSPDQDLPPPSSSGPGRRTPFPASPSPLSHPSSSSSNQTIQDSSLTKSSTLLPHHQQQPAVDSKEDQNSVGQSPVTAAQIAAAKAKVDHWLSPGQPGSFIFPPPSTTSSQLSSSSSTPPNTTLPTTNNISISIPPRICLLDGFLLFSPTHLPPTILSQIDVRLFLTVSREKATRRREARDGYVTLEGFWTDPPGYVDKIVWPNYCEAHAWLFEGGDVEGGRLDADKLREWRVRCPGEERKRDKEEGGWLDVPFEQTLDWAVQCVMAELERLVLGRGEGRGKE